MGQSTVKTLLSGVGALTIWGIIGYALTFFFSVLVARHFGPSIYGSYSLLVVIISLGALLSVVGLVKTVMRYGVTYRDDKGLLSGLMRFSMLLPFVLSLIVSAIVYVLAGPISQAFSFAPGFTPYIRIASFAIPFLALNQILRAWMFAGEHNSSAGFSYNVIDKGVPLIAVVLITVLGLDVYYLILGLVLSFVVALVYNAAYLQYKKELLARTRHRPLLRISEWTRFSLPLFATDMVARIVGWTDVIIIGIVLTSTEVGVYQIALGLALFTVFFQTIFRTISIPLFSRLLAEDAHEEITRLHRRSAVWVVLMTAPFFAIFVFFSRDLVSWVYGDAFLAGAPALIILSLAHLINVASGMNAELLTVYKKTTSILHVNLAVVTANIVMNLVLLWWIGFIGAAIASAASIIIQNIVLLVLARRMNPINLDIRSSLLAITCALAAGLAVSLMLAYVLPASIIGYGIALALFGAIYIGLLFGIRVVTARDLDMLLDMIGMRKAQ